jgi:hypothetical protein
MRGMGQYDTDSGSGLNTSAVSVNQNPYIPSMFSDLSNLPLNTTAPIAPAVSAIPCESGQTCSYISNVPDWVLFAGALIGLALFIAAVKR